MSAVAVNGRTYRLPMRPTVVVCVDGGDPRYFEAALSEGVAPTLARFRARGTYRLARGAMPSFTNPNNVSIVTGVPPAVHGIAGNYFYDRAAEREIMMNDPAFLRCPTLLAALARAGARVVVITAKDKLRRLLGHELEGVCFSSEKAAEVTKDEHGIEGVSGLVPMPVPDVYSAALSEYVLAAGLELLRREAADVMYLSLTDYVQHKHPPGTPAASAFSAMLDRYLDAFEGAGATVGVTADHGMGGKARPDGSPNVVYLAPLLEALLGLGAFRVVLPITDPYVVHHGALGSFATIYLARPADVPAVMARLGATPGVAEVHDAPTAAARFELPADRVGDVVVVADPDVVLGKAREAHDLSLLEGPLRSHGGLSEQIVPLVLSRPLRPDWTAPTGELRNFDVFDAVLNGAA